MTHHQTTDNQFVQTIIVIILSYAWIAFLCALLGLFHVLFVFFLWGVSLFALFKMRIIHFVRPTRIISHAMIAIGVVSAVLLFTSTPSVFSGRDHGTLSSAAFSLQKNHTPTFHTEESDAFFALYGPGKALHFPGFHYTRDGALTPQFPLPYIAFLAGFVGLFSSYGIIIANSVLFFLFFITIIAFARTALSPYFTYWLGALLLSAPPLLYVASRSLSENLANALLFSALFLFFSIKKSPTTSSLTILFFTLFLLLFTRIEGLWIFSAGMIALLLLPDVRAQLRAKARTYLPLLFATVFTVILLVLIVNTAFYKTMAEVFFSTLPLSSSTSIDASASTNHQFLLGVLLFYNILIPLLLAIAGVIILALKKRYALLLPLALTGPLFLYIIAPQITLDAPWMVRRFVFALLPLMLFYMLFFLAFLRQKTYGIISTLILIALVSYNIFISDKLLVPVDHATLLSYTQHLAEHTHPTDLILLSPNVSGDHFAMLGAPLRTIYNRHAVYFFNPDDWKRLNTDAFTHVFLVVAEQDRPLYDKLLAHSIKEQSFVITDAVRPPQTTLPLTLTQSHTTTKNTIYQLK